MKKIAILTTILVLMSALGAGSSFAQSRVNIDALNQSATDFVKSEKKFKDIVFSQTKLITHRMGSGEKLVRDPTRVTLEAGNRYTVIFLVDGEAVKEVDLTCYVDKGVIDPPGVASGPTEMIKVPHVKDTSDFTFAVKETAEFTFFVTTWEELPKEGAYYTIMVARLVAGK